MIIGINTGHDSSFAILETNGNVKYILEEERFNRVKNTSFSTHLSLEYLIKNTMLIPDEVTDLVFDFEIADSDITFLMNKCYQNVLNDFCEDVLNKVKAYSKHPICFSPTIGFGTKTDFYREIENLKKIFPNAKISSYKHHLCHAASAFYPSGFKSSAILIIDGAGRLETVSIWHAMDNEITFIKQLELPHSLGNLYWLFGSYINLEEGKTMGLASYGIPKYKNIIYDKILDVSENGDFKFKIPLIFWFDMDSDYAISQLENIFGIKRRVSQDSPIKQFHADIASSIQSVIEEILIKLAKQAKDLTNEENLCLAGGVIQNCVANGKLVDSKIFKNIWIQPMANDSGAALGAALIKCYLDHPKVFIRWSMKNAYCGIGYDNSEIEQILDRVKIKTTEINDIEFYCANEISKGKVIARFVERSEVGPRALGNRSILSDSRYKMNHFTVNQIKQRECWRPLAPSILHNYMGEYFESICDSPFMILSFDVKNNVIDDIPAAVHVDCTARPQTVSKFNDNYYILVKKYFEITKIPILLNTSFNLKEEPIVQHPIEAIRDVILSDIDILQINNFIIEEFNTNTKLKTALRNNKYCGLYFEYFKNSKIVYFLESHNIQLEFIKTIFEWLQIQFITLSKNELILHLNTNYSIELICEPFELFNILNEIDKKIYDSDNKIYVLENSGFLSKNSVLDYKKLMIENLNFLKNLIGNKEILIFAILQDSNFISKNLRDFGYNNFIVIYTSAELKNFNPNPHQTFLIVSRNYMDNHNLIIKNLGYVMGQCFIQWDL